MFPEQIDDTAKTSFVIYSQKYISFKNNCISLVIITYYYYYHYYYYYYYYHHLKTNTNYNLLAKNFEDYCNTVSLV